MLLRFGPIIAALSAVGAKFPLDDRILAPTLAASVVLGGAGQLASRRRYGRWLPLGLHVASPISVLVFTVAACGSGGVDLAVAPWQ